MILYGIVQYLGCPLWRNGW